MSTLLFYHLYYRMRQVLAFEKQWPSVHVNRISYVSPDKILTKTKTKVFSFTFVIQWYCVHYNSTNVSEESKPELVG
jgi:hypothetical protein